MLAALRRHGVPAAALTLEITETAAVDDSAMADAGPRRARRGRRRRSRSTTSAPATPRSCGSPRFPICEIKIDRSFVREMHNAKLPIVATTIELAHALGLRVVAEGIEDAAHARARCARSAATSPRATTSRARCCDADFAAWLRIV